ncbi:MAG: UvrB/UvrC motif-containing protein [Syntrophomonas sp.]
MYCDQCKQKPASVHVTHMYNGQKIESHLCDECAAQKGAWMFDMGNSLSIPHLLGSIFGNDLQEVAGPSYEATCPNCGMTFSNIKQVGKLGCSVCYTAFEQEMEPTLRRISGSSKHVGKIPARSGQQLVLRKQIEDLKTILQQCVSSEKYEEAVEIRDAIKELEKNLE